MSNPVIAVYTDGENKPAGYDQFKSGFAAAWASLVGAGVPEFVIEGNLKDDTVVASLPRLLKRIVEVRNPDLYLVDRSTGAELGGVEITTHSPDGSNVDKRYPLLWISRRVGVHALVATPYQKRRPSGQTNRFPHRHAQRNLAFLAKWNPTEQRPRSHLWQLLPLRDLQAGSIADLPRPVRSAIPTWDDVGRFFGYVLIDRIAGSRKRHAAQTQLQTFKERLLRLAHACVDNTGHTDASSLLRLPDRWIQVYNTRPDSGHWERGEGQFDSIDGRLMFTLDWIGSLPKKQRPSRFEFWLPQLVSRHPWVLEQQDRGFGSKRFRNIMVVLASECKTKFADDLTGADWQLLRAHLELVLERLDWDPGVYSVTENVPKVDRRSVAANGLERTMEGDVGEIESLLNDANLFFSSHRAYLPDWDKALEGDAMTLRAGSRVLVPRVPSRLLARIRERVRCRLIAGEECTKADLMVLRQIHRNVGQRLRKI